MSGVFSESINYVLFVTELFTYFIILNILYRDIYLSLVDAKKCRKLLFLYHCFYKEPTTVSYEKCGKLLWALYCCFRPPRPEDDPRWKKLIVLHHIYCLNYCRPQHVKIVTVLIAIGGFSFCFSPVIILGWVFFDQSPHPVMHYGYDVTFESSLVRRIFFFLFVGIEDDFTY